MVIEHICLSCKVPSDSLTDLQKNYIYKEKLYLLLSVEETNGYAANQPLNVCPNCYEDIRTSVQIDQMHYLPDNLRNDEQVSPIIQQISQTHSSNFLSLTNSSESLVKSPEPLKVSQSPDAMQSSHQISSMEPENLSSDESEVYQSLLIKWKRRKLTARKLRKPKKKSALQVSSSSSGNFSSLSEELQHSSQAHLISDPQISDVLLSQTDSPPLPLVVQQIVNKAPHSNGAAPRRVQFNLPMPSTGATAKNPRTYQKTTGG